MYVKKKSWILLPYHPEIHLLVMQDIKYKKKVCGTGRTELMRRKPKAIFQSNIFHILRLETLT